MSRRVCCGGATPDAWKREQIANQYRFNHNFWEGLNNRYGYDGRTPKYLTMPETVDEYHIRQWEKEMGQRGGSGGQAHTVPATKPKKWSTVNKLGGGLMAVSFYPLGTTLGNAAVDAVGGLFGFDANDLACSWQGGVQWAEILTGRDCSGLASFEQDYIQDGKIVSLWCIPPDQVGDLTACYKKAGVYRGHNFDVWCFTGPASPHTGWTFWVESLTPTGSVSGRTNYVGGAKISNSYCDAVGVPSGTPGFSRYITAQAPSLTIYFQRGTNGEKVYGEPDDVDASFECIVHMTDGTVVRSTGESTKLADGKLAGPQCPGVPDGKSPDRVEIKDQNGDTVSDEKVTPETQDWWRDYPECRWGGCKLDLIKKPKASCFDLEDGCVDWWTDPQRDQKYQCRYGVKDVDIKECAVYSGLFQPGRTDKDSPYSDPDTGEWSGGENTKGKDKEAYDQKIQNPDQGRSCKNINTKGFDPIGFVMRPIQCALEWAFVPRPKVVEVELAGGEDAWKKKPPAVIAGAVKGFSVAPTASGCSKSVTIFDGAFQNTITPLDACPGSWSAPVAAISKVATTAIMVVLVVVIVRRQISGMVGYGAGQ